MFSNLIKGWAAMKVYDVARDYLGNRSNRSAQSDRNIPSAPRTRKTR